jgi:thiamine biosynthesis lipoprotein ApbE
MLPFKRVKPALGTLFEITMKNVDQEEALLLTTRAFEEVYRLEKIFNTFDPQSELSKLNTVVGKKVYISLEMQTVLKFGFRIECLSRKAFRLQPLCQHPLGSCFELTESFITRLSQCRFDLGGVAKGFIVDRIFDGLRLKKPKASIIVNAGGDLKCHGSEDIELRVPCLGEEKHFTIKSFQGALATSSLLGSHIKTGTAAAHYEYLMKSPAIIAPATVTVGANSCMAADALTKVLLFNKKTSLPPKTFRSIFSFSFDSLGRSL